MTAAAEARIKAKIHAGQPITPEDTLATIDSPEELAGFMDQARRSGMTDATRVAAYRRQKQIGETK